jgi:hypothetical protein
MALQTNTTLALFLGFLMILTTTFPGISGENVGNLLNNVGYAEDGADASESAEFEDTDIEIYPDVTEISYYTELKTIYPDVIEEGRRSTFSITYTFPAPFMEKIGEYDIPQMGSLRHEIIPGMPTLPVKSAEILLPENGVLAGIEITGFDKQVLDGPYLIKPGEGAMIIGSENPVELYDTIDSSVYESNDMYPGIQGSVASVQTVRGYNILFLKLYPLQYIPALGKLHYFKSMDITITTISIGETSPLYRGLPEDRDMVADMVDNPYILDSYEMKKEQESKGGIVPLSLTNSSETYQYVIITNNAMASTFQSLADNKNSSGIQTIVVTKEAIVADPDYDGNDTQEEIRNFIKDAYLNWSTSYVLLGGDDDIMPHRGCYGYVFSVSGPTEDNDIPTDLYFGGLDGNWDNDGDSIFGEKDSANGGGGDSGEESDILAEVYIGRAPVSTVIEAQTFVDKVTYFEANPRPKHVTLHGETDSSGPYYLDYIKNGEGGVSVDGVESYIPSVYNITRLYEKDGHNISVSIWEQEIANNTLFVNHGGHGNVQSYEIKEGTFYSDTNADDVVNTYYPIHLSIACYSGSFDGRRDDGGYVADRDCMAEEYIINPDGGFVATILNTRFGWFISFDVAKYSGELDNEFYNQLFNNFIIRIGETLQRTKNEFISDALTQDTYRWVVYEWNLLGDPTMQIFGQDNVTPIADAGADNSTGTDTPIMLDGSGSWDDSGYISWFNWSFGDGNYTNKTGPKDSKVVHSYSSIGVFTVTLNVSDAWGNWDNDTCNITVWDATPPNTTLTIENPKHRASVGDDWNITQTTSFNLSAWDKYSGVNFTWYIIDGVYFEFNGMPFTLSGYSEGPHNISYGSEDFSGNNGTINITVWIDESGPSTLLSIDEPKHPDLPNDGCNVTSNTPLTLIGLDNPVHSSGIAFAWYFIDSDYYEGTTFDLSGYIEGSYTITWGSEDNLGNNGTANMITIWVDDSKPQTLLTIDSPRYPLSPFDECNVTSKTTFTLTPNDNPSHNAGVNITWYTIDADYYEGTSFNLSGYTEGQHNITWGSSDHVDNNETGNLISVWLDDTEPQTILIIGDPQHPKVDNDGSNVTSSSPFVLTPQDYPAHDSGVAFTWYKIDSDYYEGTLFNLTGYAEGAHIISWGSQDNVENNETNTITVWLDDTMPYTVLIIGAEKFPIGGFDGCNVTENTQFTLIPEDYPQHNSSIKLSWFTIDGKYYEGTEFQLADFGLNEGAYTITWGSVDNVDINETGNSIVVYLDKLAPKTNAEIGDPCHRDYDFNFWNVTKETVINLNSSDNYAGVAFSWYIIEGEYFQGASFTLADYDDGTYTILYGSQDNLGYNESQRSITITIDTTAPSSYLDVGEPKYRLNTSDYWNITTSTMFNLFSDDGSSGVEIDWYIIDGMYYEGPVFNLMGYSDGMHTITWGAIDRLGNNRTMNTTYVIIDSNPPITDIIVNDLKYRTNESHPWNVTSSTLFELQAMDDFCDVNFIWFEINGNYFEGTSFNLSGFPEGLITIKMGSVDMVGNNATGSTYTIRLDDSPPQTDIDIGTPRHRESVNDIWNVTRETIFILELWDSSSGIKTIWYTIDGEYFQGQQFNLSGYSNGNYNITWGCMDNLNHNETPDFMLVQLDIISPITNASMDGPVYRFNEEDIWNVTQSTHFTLTSYDEYCGVDFIWYTIDGEYFEDEDFLLIGYSDGIHNITYGAQDILGNKEVASSLRVNIDTTSPETTITIGNNSPPLDDRYSMNTSELVALGADDGEGTGIDFIWYSVDGGSTYSVYDSPFTVPLSTNTIMFGARDHIGNNASSTLLQVDVDEPEIDDDFDDDGVKNDVDEFPYDPTEWIDTDSDGIGDNADLDDDNDGYPDVNDAFPFDDTEWLDTDNDTVGDNEDLDDDDDGHLDTIDVFPLDPTEWKDNDNDNIGDNSDPDDDDDGHPDTDDAFPLDPTEWKDTDSDGIGDNEDKDDDGDGLDDDSVPAMMKDNAFLLILIFIIIAILLVILIIMRGRKGEKESVDFQKGGTPVQSTYEVQAEEVEVMVLEDGGNSPNQIKWQ